MLNVAIMTYVTVLGHYGTAEVAAYGIGTRLMSFSWIPGTGFSVAAATLVDTSSTRGAEIPKLSTENSESIRGLLGSSLEVVGLPVRHRRRRALLVVGIAHLVEHVGGGRSSAHHFSTRNISWASAPA